MKIFKRQFFPIFFIAGMALFSCGIGAGYFTTRLNVVMAALSVAGALCLFLSFLTLSQSFREIFLTRQFNQTIWYFLAVISLGACLIVVNLFATKYNQRFDLTKTKQHTLSAATQDILQDLRHTVNITAFHVGLPPHYLEDLLKEYERLSNGKVKTEIIDPLVDIGYAAQFGNIIAGDEKRIIVRSGKERKDLEYKDGPLTEEMVTNTIIKVVRDKRRLYFITGHGEYNTEDSSTTGYSTLKNSLESRNFSVHALWLETKNKIPEDCDCLVIAGPKNPLSTNEQTIIQEYLKNGGKALFLVESLPVATEDKPLTDEEKSKNPSLNSLLSPWGIKLGNDIVVDLENHVGADVGCPATKNYPKHKEIIRGLDYTFYIRPRSITILKDHPSTLKIAPLVFSSSKDNSWAETNQFLHVKFDENDTPGPIILGAVIWEKKNDNKKADTKIIVFSDADFASNTFISQYSNADMILNSLSWLSDLENITAIEAKTTSVEQLDLTSKQLRLLVLILVAMPLFIACAGSIVWWKQTTTK